MLNEIIKGISMQLNASFGDGYKIYQNDVEQGLKEPCFFIAVLKPEQSPLLGARKFRRNPFDIHYFPSADGNNRELFDAAERMMECLRFIRLPNGNLLHGTSMSCETVDGILHFFVNYNLIQVKSGEEAPLMETLELDVADSKQKG